MRHISLLLVVVFLFAVNAFGSACADTAEVVAPSIPIDTKADFETKLNAAKADHYGDPRNADALIWYGRRTAYLGDYKKAIHIFAQGIRMHPKDARMYRHRGHRFISIRCFDDAIKDFEKASVLVKGKPDEVEPDGLPNAKNIPTSTLQSNIWYHLGLAYYLNGDFKEALDAYRECLKVSKNPDMLIATVNWYYVTLRRLNNDTAATKLLDIVADDLEIIENDSYYDLVKLYKGKLETKDLAPGNGDALSNASVLYGLGNWELINGNKSDAKGFFERIVNGNQWSSFGFIAAEAEMKRMKAGTDNF